MRPPVEIMPGKPSPLGATVQGEGVNFSLFSSHATAVELLLFDRYDQPRPSLVIPLLPPRHQTYYYWHAFVRGIGDGQLYGYRVYGPYQPEEGLRFNPHKVLLDPYARAVAYGANWSRAEAHGLGDNCASAMKAVVVDTGGYDWEGDEPLQRPLRETILYETHVRSLTAHPSSGVAQPGSYAGLVDKIPYLRELGITAVELLPVHQFDEQEVNRRNPLTGQPLKNYWGYAPVAYLAPHLGHASTGVARQAVDEFRDMVKALHRAGLEVILDVVFNHTAEWDETGPTISFRGLDNHVYYILQANAFCYANYTGCGNTVNGNHSVVRRLIRDCLRHWVSEYHVDGFRFDLASVLARGEDGAPLRDAPVLWEIESDPALAGTKLIAEAWDAAGLYQVGDFTGDRWAEWNDRFRDDVRRFMRGDAGTVRNLGWRMGGSFDVFRNKPSYVSPRSINFLTCHDGFTLADLVAYNDKHNEANGEANRDGTNDNLSWNGGVEGPTADARILALRRRQIKNGLALLLLARGTPMLLGGDELGRTQQGNNNAYCQDNEISWFDWRMVEQNADLLRFAKGLIALRQSCAALTREIALRDRHYEQLLEEGITFHGVQLKQPDWGHDSHSLAWQVHGQDGAGDLYIIANAYSAPLDFALPPGARWQRLVDTSLSTPEDCLPRLSAPPVTTPRYRAGPRAVVVLASS